MTDGNYLKDSSRLYQFVKSRQHERIYKNSKKFQFFEKNSYFCLFVLYTFRISRAILNTLVAKKLYFKEKNNNE